MPLDSTNAVGGEPSQTAPGELVDSFGRRITYVRMSVTDRCDLRCRYCMPEKMQFAAHAHLLSIDEITALADIFISRGVKRIRLTGGEPLVRPGVEHLCRALGARVGNGLDELTLTTNGMRLERFAKDLASSGVRRINVSLDSRDPDRFRYITRHGDVSRVLRGIAAVTLAGVRVKINMVVLKDLNEHEISSMLRWCGDHGHDLTLIETMPMGDVEEDRTVHYVPLSAIRARLEEEFNLTSLSERTGGPARYVEVEQLGVRLGFITPLTQNFCEGCNRVRVTATGRVYACLGHEHQVDVREALRSGATSDVQRALDRLVAEKPRGHEFKINGLPPALARHMSVTGG